MKKTFLILAVLLICIGYHGFAQSQELTLVPVNSQIEAFNRGTLAWHDYSVSRPFSININIQNGNTGPGNTNEDRIIILGDDARTTSEFTFDGSERGRYVDSEAGRCFYISFRDFERAVMLKFTKNHQLDRFILDSIQIDGNPPRQITNNTRGEHVTLLISLIDNRRNSGSRELRYEEITRNNNLSNNNSNINFRNDNFGNENSRDVRAANSNSRYIIGNGSLSIDGVYQYIIRNGSPVLSNSAIRELLMLYFNEAAYENVNHDIAIAQMLYWTANLSDRERINSNNFAGLSRTQNWSGSFS
ncbi:MAG: hypothetical protein FWB83_04715, partial [Treponema sp.]|nr:hypothetical protein [Treponema sp.]